ncbi:MAG: transcriptional activator NhaR [Polyangiales bacterium]
MARAVQPLRPMEWLNYHHLYYFWVVAKEGSIAAASKRLRLASPTVSGQLRLLEDAIGQRLFERTTRSLELTETGRLALRYADEIFTLGKEFGDAVRNRPTGRPTLLTVGVADAVPKVVAQRVLAPALDAAGEERLVCREDRHDRLLEALADHALDAVLTDAPAGPAARGRVFNHPLGECGVSFVGDERLVAPRREGFPRSLDGAPMLLPGDHAGARRSLDAWFDVEGIRPKVVGEFDDTALMKVFGAHGAGLFAVPSVVEEEVCRQYGVALLGRTTAVRERFYAVTAERRLKHPAVVALCSAARHGLFP